MSLFGSMLRDFDDDVFFGGAPRDNLRHMEGMMENFMSPFDGMLGGFGFPQLMGAPAAVAMQDTAHHRGGRRRNVGGGAAAAQQLMPFGGFGRASMFPDIGNLFNNMGQMTSADPNCHMYSSSSVVTYSLGDDGQPKMYQASSTTRTAPGGVKETRKMMADSTSGMQKMEIGHHLGERAHLIEKAKNRSTGQLDESQEFINLDETEAETFDREWRMRTAASMGAGDPSAIQYQSSRPYELREGTPPVAQLAITAGPSQDRAGRKRERQENNKLSSGGHPYLERGRKSRSNKRSSSSGGHGGNISRASAAAASRRDDARMS